MPRLPSLERWEPTAHGLHAAARLLDAIRRLVRERVPSYLHLALRAERTVLSTETLPTGGSVRLDFGRAALVYICPAGKDRPLPLAGHSQRSLFEALLAEMHARGVAFRLNTRLTDAGPGVVVLGAGEQSRLAHRNLLILSWKPHRAQG